MAVPETGLSIDHIVGAASVLVIPVVTTLIDYLAQSLLDRKIFEPLWSGARRRFKAWRTKRNKITSDYEFSIYLSSNLSFDNTRDIAADLLEKVDQDSDGDFDIIEQKWSDDDREIDITARYKNRKEPYELRLNFVPDSGDAFDTEFDPSIGSVGVTITFQFEFGQLKGSMIDLMLFARFFRDAVTDLLPVRSVTDGRFVVTPIDNDLTLDEWIKKEQFDVSLLLESQDQRSSVEFHGNKAVISSPHTDVDDKTVEYIRATLLNYYL